GPRADVERLAAGVLARPEVVQDGAAALLEPQREDVLFMGCPPGGKLGEVVAVLGHKHEHRGFEQRLHDRLLSPTPGQSWRRYTGARRSSQQQSGAPPNPSLFREREALRLPFIRMSCYIRCT